MGMMYDVNQWYMLLFFGVMFMVMLYVFALLRLSDAGEEAKT